ncbi:MAG: DegT/DnrJ/EryC1/StrS family aminotransferase [Pseudomonadota bacterium]
MPADAVEAAMAILQSGRLHRYNVASGETAEAALLEQEFAAYTGARYCLSVTSGGYALATALRAIGVSAGDKVLTNAFTLAPVPGAIASVGAEPVLVEITDDLTIDLDDLGAKAKASGARVLMLSLMRGHLPDMTALMARANALGLTVIEDCAHTMGASWDGTPSGRFGAVGCFSTQTYKHMNSGEGGFLISDDADLIARATVLSGSYMLYDRHIAGPDAEVFDTIRLETPNCSGRMDNLRAAILRPQLRALDANRVRWNERYRAIETRLTGNPHVVLRRRPNSEQFVGSSIQLRLPTFSAHQVSAVIAQCAARGVELKWFGPDEPVAFTSRHVSWRYMPNQDLPMTDRVLATLLDMRLPLTFSLADCALIGSIISEEVSSIA